jgi:hypothetical protein
MIYPLRDLFLFPCPLQRGTREQVTDLFREQVGTGGNRSGEGALKVPLTCENVETIS